MPGQVNYYNDFGEIYKQSILSCPEPELWTTDYDTKGRVFREMRERVEQQQKLISAYFTPIIPVLDIGCGFGRQSISLAKNGYTLTGTDTSDVFIDIAKELFLKHGFEGRFICTDIINGKNLPGQQKQILLLDVLEHIKPFQRRAMFSNIYDISGPEAIIIISLPHLKKRLTSQLNNVVRRSITQYIPYFLKREEHPYPIPGKNMVINLAKGLFTLNTFTESPETDYYVFIRN